MKILRKIFAVLMCVLLLGTMLLPLKAEDTKHATILFTHDLHSHLLPAEDEDGGEYGGYARLMSVINEQKAKYPDAILVDGGDFSMGSLFQTAFATSAIELRIMGQMGYDATTFGNHEFDYLPEGLASMLNVAVESGDALPAIVDANYLPPKQNEEGYTKDSQRMWDALENYGVQEYILLERGGIYYALFGLTGYNSDEYAPNSGMILQNPAETAQQVVDEATDKCIELYGVEPVVVALSHSGTSKGEGEDYELAKSVNGIDVIVSAHTHTTLHEPIIVNDTAIVSAGCYGKYLGIVQLEMSHDGSVKLSDYELIPIDETIEEDHRIASLVESYKAEVEETYLSNYGMTFDQVLLNNQIEFETVSEVKGSQHESTLGNLFSDAYKWMIEKTTGETVDLAVTANGVIRESLPLGEISVSDVFNAASLGVGTEGELILIYLTGKDVKTVLEIDASVYPLMKAAGLYSSGVRYSYNLNRMIFNKVDSAHLYRKDGSLEEINDDQMYKVVAGMYAGQMLGSVKDKSFGLLSVTPRDASGNPIPANELVNYVVKDAYGTPVKEWHAISSYLLEMGGSMDTQYASTDGRKIVYSSLNPADLLRNANGFTYAFIGIAAGMILILTACVRFVIRRNKSKK